MTTPNDDTDKVLVGRIGKHIATITLNRPDARNAVNGEMAAKVFKFINETEADPAIRVGIFTGNGKVFSAGGDLKDVAGGRDIRIPRAGGFCGFTETRRRKPWIAAVNGPAYGGGTELTLACDLSVVSRDATFALTEVKRGLTALGGGVVYAPRRLPYAVAVEMLITGEPLAAERAYQMGMINRVVPTDQVLAEAVRMAEGIAANSPYNVRESLRMARATSEISLDEMWRMNQKALELLYYTHDFREGPKAFVEKRQPHWDES